MLRHKSIFLSVGRHVCLRHRIIEIEIAVYAVRIGHSIGKIKIIVNSASIHYGHIAVESREFVKLINRAGIHLGEIIVALLRALVLLILLSLSAILKA